MKQRLGSAVLGLVALGACSVLNAPEALQTDGRGGGGNVGATGNTGGKSSNAGSTSAGGDGTAGSMVGMGGCGVDCPEGGAPPIGKDCESSADDCASTAPICDATDFECRPCGGDPECQAEVQLPYCLQAGDQAGRCAECRTEADCPSTTPVCNPLGICRSCVAHQECSSGVCDATGTCVPEDQVVYALAQTGSDDGAACGTRTNPCLFVSVAAMKLTPQRPNLVLLETSAVFDYENVTLPAVAGIHVIGNGLTVQSNNGGSVFSIAGVGAEVTFEDVVIENATGEDQAGIRCSSGAINVIRSTLRNNAMGVHALDCDVVVTESVIEHNAVPLQYQAAGIRAECAIANCPKVATLTRNRFIDNGVAVYVGGQQFATIENNLFLRNGADGYTRVMELRAQTTRFAYNTLVENYNGCSYVGVVACDQGTCNNIGNVSYASFPAAAEPCYDQVWYQGTLSYSLTELTEPGPGNKTGNPLFVDAANGDYSPGPGSPALDGGNPGDAPSVDINGNPRPSGNGPDMGAFEAN